MEAFVSEQSIGADACCWTGVLTFDGNRRIKEKVTYERICQHLQQVLPEKIFLWHCGAVMCSQKQTSVFFEELQGESKSQPGDQGRVLPLNTTLTTTGKQLSTKAWIGCSLQMAQISLMSTRRMPHLPFHTAVVDIGIPVVHVYNNHHERKQS